MMIVHLKEILKNIQCGSLASKYKESVTTAIESNSKFVGVDFDLFFGVGVHIKIGFNI